MNRNEEKIIKYIIDHFDFTLPQLQQKVQLSYKVIRDFLSMLEKKEIIALQDDEQRNTFKVIDTLLLKNYLITHMPKEHEAILDEFLNRINAQEVRSTEDFDDFDDFDDNDDTDDDDMNHRKNKVSMSRVETGIDVELLNQFVHTLLEDRDKQKWAFTFENMYAKVKRMPSKDFAIIQLLLNAGTFDKKGKEIVYTSTRHIMDIKYPKIKIQKIKKGYIVSCPLRFQYLEDRPSFISNPTIKKTLEKENLFLYKKEKIIVCVPYILDAVEKVKNILDTITLYYFIKAEEENGI